MTESHAITPRLTVAICTWNRSALLRKTLEQLTHLRPVDGCEWELIVVDNNSTDDTPRVVSEFISRLPIRSLREPSPGKSNAANLAVREARGEYMLWTDDDVLVDPDWMRAYVAAFRRFPDADVFGGLVNPWFEGTPPRWLMDGFKCVESVYAALDLRRPGGAADYYPVGANMAIKRSAHLRHPFNPRIGPQPGSNIRGEEWLLVRDLRNEGSEVIWVPEAKVKHFIPRARQTEAYLRDWFHGHGELLAKLDAKKGVGTLLGRPLWLWRQWLGHGLRARVGRSMLPAEQWLRSFALSETAWGHLSNYQRDVPLR